MSLYLLLMFIPFVSLSILSSVNSFQPSNLIEDVYFERQKCIQLRLFSIVLSIFHATNITKLPKTDHYMSQNLKIKQGVMPPVNKGNMVLHTKNRQQNTTTANSEWVLMLD